MRRSAFPFAVVCLAALSGAFGPADAQPPPQPTVLILDPLGGDTVVSPFRAKGVYSPDPLNQYQKVGVSLRNAKGESVFAGFALAGNGAWDILLSDGGNPTNYNGYTVSAWITNTGAADQQTNVTVLQPILGRLRPFPSSKEVP